MRTILVGTRAERQSLRERLNGSVAADIVADFESLAEARASGVIADAIVLAPPDPALEDEDGPVLETLTGRETEVLELVAQGLSNKGVGERLGISDQTVKFHIASIAGKLGAANRTDAVRRAVRRGLIAL